MLFRGPIGGPFGLAEGILKLRNASVFSLQLRLEGCPLGDHLPPIGHQRRHLALQLRDGLCELLLHRLPTPLRLVRKSGELSLLL